MLVPTHNRYLCMIFIGIKKNYCFKFVPGSLFVDLILNHIFSGKIIEILLTIQKVNNNALQKWY